MRYVFLGSELDMIFLLEAYFVVLFSISRDSLLDALALYKVFHHVLLV